MMMMHCGLAATTCSQETEVQLCLSDPKMLVPPPRLIRALIMARPGPVNGADWPLS